METELARIAELAKSKPKLQFNSIGHLINEQALIQSHFEMESRKAIGVDGVTKETYEENLTDDVAGLVKRLKQKSYKPKPARRTYIPKDGKSLRPLGIPAYEDKLVQDVLKKVLEAIYEQDFMDLSYGFRPGRNMHDALKKMNGFIQNGMINYVVDADIKGFFNHVDHEWMMKFIGLRVGDPNILRVVRRMLKAGIQENGEFEPTEEGTPQGSVASPIFSNIYLHYVLDLWFEVKVKKQCRGQAEMVRFADDFVCCFQYKEDAERFYTALMGRLAKFNLNVAEEKTKIIEFGRFAIKNRKRRGMGKPDTFDFLGFTHYCSKSRKGAFRVKRKTSGKKFRQKLRDMKSWIRMNRHLDQEAFLRIISSKLMGHYRYYGITDNSKKIQVYFDHTNKLIFKWLNRRSQKRSFTWERYKIIQKKFRLPKPRIYVNIFDKLNL